MEVFGIDTKTIVKGACLCGAAALAGYGIKKFAEETWPEAEDGDTIVIKSVSANEEIQEAEIVPADEPVGISEPTLESKTVTE